MKTDADLRKDVMAELAWDPAIRSTDVGVAVKDGVVTLTGHLDTFAEKFAIERALRRVAGVLAIALELDVKLAPRHKRSDTEIAVAAEHALK
jgi:osmotically-inducible protein OsmY